MGIEVEVAEDYSKLKDPYKLLAMAACDRCSDLREERRRILGDIDKIIFRLAVLKGQELLKFIAQISEPLAYLTKEYCKLAARWNGLETEVFDQGAVDAILNLPSTKLPKKKLRRDEIADAAAAILGRMCKLNHGRSF